MKTNCLHIFEYRQMIHDSPGDQSLQTQLDNHLAVCADCRDFQILIQRIHESSDIKSTATRVQRISDSQIISNIKKHVQYNRFLPGLFRPLPDLAWIILIILSVVFLSWGITRLRAGQNIVPASSIIVSQPSPTPTEVIPVSPACRPIAYIVKEKDTLLAISAYFNVPMDILWKGNNLGNDSVLTPGMHLSIPFCGWTPVIDIPDINKVTPIDNCPQVIYAIQQGDTVEDISAFFGIPGILIVSDNQLLDHPVLTPGDTLVIRLCKIP